MAERTARPLRAAMVGGGNGAFIGPVHRIAAELDGRLEIVAGAFSSDARRSTDAAIAYDVDERRAYASYLDLIEAESLRRARGEDVVDVVIVAAPNGLHVPVSRAALAAGFHVMCDKPLAMSLEEGRSLARDVRETDRVFGLTQNYTGFPAIREARALCLAGEIGLVRKVVVEYSQGWLSEPIELAGHKQASWRTDPLRSGAGGCVSDIGVHAFNLAEFASGQPIEAVCAALTTVVPGRAVDDDCNVLLRFADALPGVLVLSQVATGDGNRLSLRIYGASGGIGWSMDEPAVLTVTRADDQSDVRQVVDPTRPPRTRRLSDAYPDAFLEAFANLYRDFADVVDGVTKAEDTLLPGIDAGLRGMAFIEACVASSNTGSAWVSITPEAP